MKFDLSEDYDRYKAKEYFDKLMTRGDKMEMIRFSPAKTYSQIKYLNVCYKLFAQHTGFTKEESKWILKKESGFMIYTKQGETFPVSAADLDADGMTLFIDFIRSYAKEQGCNIISSEDYIRYQFEIDKDLQNVK